MFHHHRSRLPIIVVDFSYKVKLNGGITAPISYGVWLYSSSGRALVHHIGNSDRLVAKGVGRSRVKVRRGVVMLGGRPRRSSLKGQVVRVDYRWAAFNLVTTIRELLDAVHVQQRGIDCTCIGGKVTLFQILNQLTQGKRERGIPQYRSGSGNLNRGISGIAA